MATYQGTSRTQTTAAAETTDIGLVDAALDATVVALIAAGFITLAFNTIARL